MGRPKKPDVDKIIEERDVSYLLQLSRDNRNKKKKFTFLEYYKNKKNLDMKGTITGLTKLLSAYIEEQLTENGKINWAPTYVEKKLSVMQVILVVIDIALVSFELKISDHSQVELALMLNGFLKDIPSSQDTTKNLIAQYCEKLYTAYTVEKPEDFMFNVVPYLFQRTLAPKAMKADVKRIHNIRNIIKPVLASEKGSSNDLWDLFSKCVIKPIYLSLLEGIKLIAFILILDIDEVISLHTIIRDYLATVNVKTAETYGRVYFEAWWFCTKTGALDLKNSIEIVCLQDFLLLAIQARHRPFLPLARKLLSQFHAKKKEMAVSKMLYCLYQPILYRFLKNPDGQSRANAAQLFLDIFPLEDPDEKIVATDLELNDQLLMIKDLLLDDFPIVRMTAILGVCISMSVNWEVFPEEMLKTYFRILVDELSRDSSSAEVRCAVVKGIKCLLENPLTISCLVSILPKLQGLFHDNSEMVRLAFCKLLLKIKKISAIKYFNIVPSKHLFARLEEDCHAVKKAITCLVNNSYFPRNEDPKIWMGRCLEIIKNERGAARVFFTYVSNFIGVENSIKFMVQACKAVHYYVKTKQLESSSQVELYNKENGMDYKRYVLSLEEAVGFNNYQTVSTVMDCITVMWLSLKGDIEKLENKCYLKMLVQKLGRPLQELCLYYKDTDAWESVFYVASYLPPALVPCLASLCFYKLKNLPSDAKAEQYMVLLECLCNQCQGSELLKLLKEWLVAGFADIPSGPPAKRRRKSRVATPRTEKKPYLACRMLESMLSHRMLQKCITENHVGDIKKMLYMIDHIKRKIDEINARSLNQEQASFLNVLMYNLLKISIFVQNEKHLGPVPFVKDVVEWTEQKLIRHLVFSLPTTDHFTNLIFSMCKNLCKIVADATALDFVDPSCRSNLILFEKLLRTGMGYKFALISARFLYKHATTAQYLYLRESDTVMAANMLSSLVKIYACFGDDTFLESIPSQELKEIEFTLANVMQVIHNHVAIMMRPVSVVFKCIIKNIIDSLEPESTKIANDKSDVKFEELPFPKTASFFMTIVNYKPALLPTYLKFFSEFYASYPITVPFWISCWAFFHRVSAVQSIPKPGLQEMRTILVNLEKVMNVLFPREGVYGAMAFQRHCYAEFFKLKNAFNQRVITPGQQR